jgi:hypothetical protein
MSWFSGKRAVNLRRMLAMMCSVSELPPVLQWDCIESGLLKVPLNLQALAWKHTVAEPKKAARLALKKLQKNVSKKAKVLGASWKKHLQDKLKGPSLSQAVAAVVPVAGGGKPAKGKNSVKIPMQSITGFRYSF